MKKYNSFIFSFLAIGLLCFTSCKKEKIEDELPKEEPEIPIAYQAAYHRSEIEFEATFENEFSNLVTRHLAESSGLVEGRNNRDLVYIHEDSGNRATVYAYDKFGKYKGEFILIGIQNRDWEDMAIGKGPEDGKNYIYIADFGDNNQAREELRIHRFEEPIIDNINEEFKINIDNVVTLKYKYPDGPRDAETLLLNPFNKSLIVVTKREANVHVYELPFPQNETDVVPITFKGALPFRSMVGGDISEDGEHIIMKTYGEVYYWQTKNQDPIKTLFDNKPVQVEYIPEVQGESIGWAANASGYYTISETDDGRAEPILYFYKRL